MAARSCQWSHRGPALHVIFMNGPLAGNKDPAINTPAAASAWPAALAHPPRAGSGEHSCENEARWQIYKHGVRVAAAAST